MNLVIDDAVEVKLASKTNPEEKRKPLGTYNPRIHEFQGVPLTPPTGQILLKGDNVSLIQNLSG